MACRNDWQRRGPLSAGRFEHEGYSRKVADIPRKGEGRATTEGRVKFSPRERDGEVIFANPVSAPEALWPSQLKSSGGTRLNHQCERRTR